jgi:hypothetical protein
MIDANALCHFAKAILLKMMRRPIGSIFPECGFQRQAQPDTPRRLLTRSQVGCGSRLISGNDR